MSFAFSDEQEELRRTVRQFLEQRSPEPEVRRLMATEAGYDPAVWAQMAAQMGLQGLHVPEALGGSGFGYVELCIVLEEMGARLLCAPFFSTVVLAANTLLASGDDAAKADLLPGIAAGATIATLAVAESPRGWAAPAITMPATPHGEAWTLTGTKRFVLDGAIADLVLVAARTDVGLSLFAVDGQAAGLTRRSMPTMDQTRKQAHLTFEQVPARLVGEDGAAEGVLQRVLDLVAVALANESVGGARAALDMAVQYAKDRVQYGRPIGSFQAIKHMCADMFFDVESSRSAASFAAGAVADASDEVPLLAPLAASYANEGFSRVAAENIQVQGGIGFTWEHPAHLYLKRARTNAVLFGDAASHRDRLALLLGF